MVRINLIHPSKLSDQHLIAEQVEILMLISYIKKYPQLDGTEPKEFTLNKGHMKFFKDKVIYLSRRYNKLHHEIIYRGFKHQWRFPDISELPKELLNDWTPSYNDKLLIRSRILSKVDMKPNWYKYCGGEYNINLLFQSI